MIAKSLHRILFISMIVIGVIWLAVPFIMAILWSLVDPAEPWTVDRVTPPVMSFYRWTYMWESSNLKYALFNSYLLAPTVSIVTLIFSISTAYVFGRYNFVGKEIAKLLCLLPLVTPYFVLSIFLTATIMSFGLSEYRVAAIVLAHAVMFLPYAIRIMTVGFEQVSQEHIDAARDLSATTFSRWRVAYLPALRPAFFASMLIVFIQSIEEFAVAFILVSPTFITIPTLLFSTMGQDFVRPNAAVLSLILVVPNIVLMLFLEKLLRTANPAMISGKGLK
jgi:putative spermidine/putrescine transport system permease protein